MTLHTAERREEFSPGLRVTLDGLDGPVLRQECLGDRGPATRLRRLPQPVGEQRAINHFREDRRHARRRPIHHGEPHTRRPRRHADEEIVAARLQFDDRAGGTVKLIVDQRKQASVQFDRQFRPGFRSRGQRAVKPGGDGGVDLRR